jgi:AFG3 family protein
MASAMVTIYGMNDKVGHVSFNDPTGEFTYSKPYSEKTGEMIDEEVRKIISQAYERTKALLTSKKTELSKLAQELLKKEILFQYDLETIIGKRPFEHKTNYENYMESGVPPTVVKEEKHPENTDPQPLAPADNEA